jgi:hypothetical protein
MYTRVSCEVRTVSVFPARYGLQLPVPTEVRAVPACFLQGTDCTCVFPVRYGQYLCSLQGTDCTCLLPVKYRLYLCFLQGRDCICLFPVRYGL